MEYTTHLYRHNVICSITHQFIINTPYRPNDSNVHLICQKPFSEKSCMTNVAISVKLTLKCYYNEDKRLVLKGTS